MNVRRGRSARPATERELVVSDGSEEDVTISRTVRRDRTIDRSVDGNSARLRGNRAESPRESSTVSRDSQAQRRPLRNEPSSPVARDVELVESAEPVENLQPVISFLRDALNQGMAAIQEAGPDLAEAGLGEKETQLREALKSLLGVEMQLREEERVYEQFSMRLRAAETDTQQMEEEIAQMRALTAQTPQIRWSRCDPFIRYHETVWEAGAGHDNPTGSMPSIEDDTVGDEEEDDGTLMMHSRTSCICPLTQGRFVDPVMNPSCGHTYSSAAIQQLMGTGHGYAIQCPVPGCDRTIERGRLVANADMVQRLARLNSRIFESVDTDSHRSQRTGSHRIGSQRTGSQRIRID